MRHLHLIAMLGMTILATGNARADMPPLLAPTTTPVTQGAFYVSIGGFGAVHRSKGFEYGTVQRGDGSFGPGKTLFSFGKSITVGGGTAAVGYALDKGDPLGGIGNLARIEFGFTLFQGSQRESRSHGECFDQVYCDYATIGFIGGPNASGQGAFGAPAPGISIGEPSGISVTSRYRGRYWGGDGTVRYRTDLHVTRRLVLTPSVGVLGGAQVFKHELSYNYAGIGLPSVYSGHVTASLSSFSVGPEIGGVLTWRASRRLQLHGGATLAVLYRQASLRGQDCGTTIDFPCPYPFVSPDLVSSSIDTNANRLAYRVGMEIGATFKARPWLHLTVTGFGSYDTAVPGIARNPVQFENGGIQNGSPAKVVFSGEWSYGGALVLTIPFR